jgi:glutamate synthase domain-containing protein 3
MLRPQVFALQEGNVKIGLIASEKQAIDAMMSSLAEDDERFYPMADRYWYARGGSYTDGGAFIFTFDQTSKDLMCTDKFGQRISTTDQRHYQRGELTQDRQRRFSEDIDKALRRQMRPSELLSFVLTNLRDRDFDELHHFAEEMRELAKNGDDQRSLAIEVLTYLIDKRCDTGEKKRSDVVSLIEEELFNIFDSVAQTGSGFNGRYNSVNWERKGTMRSPEDPTQTLIIDVRDFKPEGDDGICQFLEKAYQLGWRKIIAYNFRGQRNFGAGLIARDKVRIDVYGRAGDCLAAFADGPEFYVHESAQDSVAYCFKSGKLVIYGDAGKAFEYGAKGGVTYILGDLNDRPLINSVGSATALVNGSCKDYMGESCMAANGFIILNGIRFDEHGRPVEQETPYQGGNLFPLAAAGSVYLRDPRQTVGEDQLNGAKIVSLSRQDWEKVSPLLNENERLFGISIENLLTVDGVLRKPEDVYRKVVPMELGALTRYENGV